MDYRRCGNRYHNHYFTPYDESGKTESDPVNSTKSSTDIEIVFDNRLNVFIFRELYCLLIRF